MIYVLIHPAWLGGWCWSKIVPALRTEGHGVHAPTLTGLGERVHLSSPYISLATHIEDVVNALEFENLQHVILVGTSSGGMVITGVADRVPERSRAWSTWTLSCPNTIRAWSTCCRLTGGEGWRSL